MLDFHTFNFEYMGPWWEQATCSPEATLRKTFAALSDIPDESVRELKRQQIIGGIEAGHVELVEMSKLFLSAPLIFLVLVDQKRGPPALAILGIVAANCVDIGGGWGKFHYDPPEDRPEIEHKFYDLLVQNGEPVAHFIRQLGLMRHCVRDELRELSSETVVKRKGGIQHFQASYPIIFVALHAAFGMQPSNTVLRNRTLVQCGTV
jgi:hypothetical protein